jgi:hypothetical protein
LNFPFNFNLFFLPLSSFLFFFLFSFYFVFFGTLFSSSAVDFFNQINMLYGTIAEFCTPQECEVMSAGPRYEYHWADEKTKVHILPFLFLSSLQFNFYIHSLHQCIPIIFLLFLNLLQLFSLIPNSLLFPSRKPDDSQHLSMSKS